MPLSWGQRNSSSASSWNDPLCKQRIAIVASPLGWSVVSLGWKIVFLVSLLWATVPEWSSLLSFSPFKTQHGLACSRKASKKVSLMTKSSLPLLSQFLSPSSSVPHRLALQQTLLMPCLRSAVAWGHMRMASFLKHLSHHWPERCPSRRRVLSVAVPSLDEPGI